MQGKKCARTNCQLMVKGIALKERDRWVMWVDRCNKWMLSDAGCGSEMCRREEGLGADVLLSIARMSFVS